MTKIYLPTKNDQDITNAKVDALNNAIAAMKRDYSDIIAPDNACTVTIKLNKEGSTYALPESSEDRGVLLTNAKVIIGVTGFATPIEVPLTTLEGFYAKVYVPASSEKIAAYVGVRLGSSETVSYAVTSVPFTAVAGADRTISLVTEAMTGERVELARCQAWNNTASGDGSSFLMTVVTNATGSIRYPGYYDAQNVFHNECKTNVTYWKCPKDADGNPDPANNEEITVIDGGENSINIMDRLAVLKSIKVATVKFTGDSASIEDNKFIRFTGPLYVKTTMETISIPVKDDDGNQTGTQEIYCCVKWYCCDFASDADAEVNGYHRHPFFIRYERDGNLYNEIPMTYGYIARYPIKSNNLVCGGATYALACSKSDGSNEVGNTRYGFLDWCRAVNKATITISVDGEEDKVIDANSDSRAMSMFELRELSFMQWMSYLFFGIDVQATMKGICSGNGDAYAQQANGKSDYIMDQGIWTGGEDPSLNYKQIVFLGVEGGIWSAPGMMYPNFTSISERITITNDEGTVTSSTRNRYIYAVDRNDYNPGSSDEAALLTAGYREVPFYIGSGNTRQGATSVSVLRDAYLPVADKTMANINVASKDAHWQGGAPGAIANYNASTTYSVDNMCIYNSKLYKCIEESTGETPDTSDKWSVVVNESITSANYYMVALGHTRGSGSSLGALHVTAAIGLADSYGHAWRSRLSIQVS